MSVDALLEPGWTHKRQDRTSNGKGGWTYGETTDLGEFSGRRNPVGFKELQLAAQLNARVTHSVYREAEADVRVGDVFESPEGTLYRVVIPNITPSVPVYQKVLVDEEQ